MNRKRSRLENMFPIEVHRSEEERENYVEVVREENELPENSPIPFGGERKNFIFFTLFSFFVIILDFLTDNSRTLRSNSLESNSPGGMNSQGVISSEDWFSFWVFCKKKQLFCRFRTLEGGRKRIYLRERRMVKEPYDKKPSILCRHECKAVSCFFV